MSLPIVPENLENISVTRDYLAELVVALTSNIDSVIANFGNFVRTDGTTELTGDLSMGGFRIVNLGDPIGQNDAATKEYVDSVVVGSMGTVPPAPTSTILAVVNQLTGSLSPGVSPTVLPSSTFSFTLTTSALVAIDICLYNETGSNGFDSGVSCLFSIKNIDTLLSTPAWVDTVSGNASGNPAWAGTMGFPGVRRVLMSLAAGSYNFQVTAQITGSGSFALTYPLSIIATLIV